MKGFRERMLDSANERKSRVVLALDISGPYEERVSKAMEVFRATKEEVAAVKLNHHLLLPFGLEGIRGLLGDFSDAGVPVIADLKLNDIESTNLNAAESLRHYGVDAVIANPFVGREEGLGKVVERMHDLGGGLILLVYMSHRGASEGYSLRVEGGEPLYRVFAERARDWGADGVVVSAKEGKKLAEAREILGKVPLIFSPGVGAQGGDAREALKGGADFVIVGRTIAESKEPLKALRGLDAAGLD
ncbi:MAG: orotidine 5'-phosphate decarboxylase [archaeon]|nr:MAG: orotidine 5'-phosphate decarboxylase [archaeon]